MTRTEYLVTFVKAVKKFKSKSQIRKLIQKIIQNPEVGKPMRYSRKGFRELYAGSYRISYKYYKNQDKVLFIDVYHKDKQ